MPEILTESFCERCGTRYTFESAAPRKTRRLGQIKTLSKGMKNWVMSDDTSLDEAMAAARNDDDREVTSQQLDAFHATFNFCMSCRQYTCGNCWNGAEGRCLSCAPHLGHEVLPAAVSEQAPPAGVRLEVDAWPQVDLTTAAAPELAAGNGNGHDAGASALESGDAWAEVASQDAEPFEEFDATARLAFLTGDAPLPTHATEAPAIDEPAAVEDAEEHVAESPSVETSLIREAAADEMVPAVEAVADEAVADELAPEPPVASAEPPVSEPLTAAATEPETAESAIEAKASTGAARTSDLLRRFRPGQNIDAELAAFEAELERAEPGAEPEPVAAEPLAVVAEPEPIAAVAAEPEPVATAAKPEPEPVAAEPQPVPATPAPEPLPAQPEPTAAAGPELAAGPEPEPEPVAATHAPEPEPEPEPTKGWPMPRLTPDVPRGDRIEQPTWQIFAPDATPAVTPPTTPAPPATPSAPAASADPQWPVRTDEVESPAMALLANRASRSSDALWAASAQEVLARPPLTVPAGVPSGVQPCTSCGLSLSATARFCRRCGTRQG